MCPRSLKADALRTRKRTICVVTGTRAEFGLLRWLLADLDADPSVELQLLVTGTHLVDSFGRTESEIEAAGFPVEWTVEMLLASDSSVGVTKSLGLGLIGLADALDRLKPDLLVLLGDRFEILAAAQAAMIAQIPIAHIHGGEATEGLIDEPIRHAVTKMSHLHFAATEEYRRRIIQLGESPDRVFNTGAPGLDALDRLPSLCRSDLEERLGHPLGEPLAVVTYHPVTLAQNDPTAEVEGMMAALARIDGLHTVFTGVNADPRGQLIAERIAGFVAEDPKHRFFHSSLGHHVYLNLLAVADLCVGNSSSGLIEAPAVSTPTVDVGERQRGRIRGPTVIRCDGYAQDIEQALRRALSPEFRREWPDDHSPYGRPGASARIHQVLREYCLDGILMKRFHDVEVGS